MAARVVMLDSRGVKINPAGVIRLIHESNEWHLGR